MVGGGRLEISTDNPNNQVWKTFNWNVKVGTEFSMENQFPNIIGSLNQKESFGRFDFKNHIIQLISIVAVPCMAFC